jgi:(p)ppGpp synthase/HD superfamily hydrolase
LNALSQAIRFAAQAHAGQLDKAGLPYIFHVMRVGMAGQTLEEQIVGFLHDVQEDTELSPELLHKNFSPEIMQALAAITREPGEMYSAYIDRVAANPLARAVKVYDLRDNLLHMWQIFFDVNLRATAVSLSARYRRALEQLGEKKC